MTACDRRPARTVLCSFFLSLFSLSLSLYLSISLSLPLCEPSPCCPFQQTGLPVRGIRAHSVPGGECDRMRSHLRASSGKTYRKFIITFSYQSNSKDQTTPQKCEKIYLCLFFSFRISRPDFSDICSRTWSNQRSEWSVPTVFWFLRRLL